MESNEGCRKVFEELMTPVDIAVMTDISIMSEPPEADILLFRRKLAGLKPQERMAGLSSEELKEIEQYINSLKNKK
ncbi:hypothetical protein MTBBW1_1310094 [Desulfamplus magnetovallimortis]|uniref:Uncharacterized protein n=1 Tax=Desulfamplus magnetovallimortis TaxID=1246637 RepID=A0A1W1H7I5_9BACT|nr:hypothetical protein [Desulfamplus magnetovallimortis]SLM28396.1 hypothetical protein MTBBW1_1310094 [Desulfamplus magnetovallimortis]